MRALPALRPLVLGAKALLKEAGLNEVFTGGLSSYSVFNMAVAHLQVGCWNQGRICERDVAKGGGRGGPLQLQRVQHDRGAPAGGGEGEGAGPWHGARVVGPWVGGHWRGWLAPPLPPAPPPPPPGGAVCS